MKRVIYLTMFFLSINGGLFMLNAQIYITGLGVNLGNPAGVNIKYFFDERHAVEGLVATSWQGYSVTGLYQMHFRFDDPKMRHTHWYLGTGAHIGHWSDLAPFYDRPGTFTTFGVDMVLGIESTFGDYPFTFGFNWIPSMNITRHFGLNIFQFGLTGRYFF